MHEITYSAWNNLYCMEKSIAYGMIYRVLN